MIAVYPGSFNPWHEGHEDVLEKALGVFEHVIVAQGVDPNKSIVDRERIPPRVLAKFHPKVTTAAYSGLFVDFLKSIKVDAVVRGLRNSADLELERTFQYWNEDLGIQIPTLYLITDRKLIHVSSSAIRTVKESRNK